MIFTSNEKCSFWFSKVLCTNRLTTCHLHIAGICTAIAALCFFVQTIVAGELQANVWAATPSPTVPVFWSALQQVVGRARELAQQALSAEAEASARATLRIKELQDQVTQSTREIDRLGQELEEKGELCDREQAHAEVRCQP
jgi:hypothetical protein